MSVLVAALTRTKNTFTNSLLKSDSKSSSEDRKSRAKFPPPIPPAPPSAEAAAAASSVKTPEAPSALVAAPAPAAPRAAVPEAANPAIVESAGPSEGEDVPHTELHRQYSARSCADSEEDECESAPVADESVLEALGPLVTIKEQLEKDKEDESLRRWKEQLLGSSAHLDSHVVEPEVKFLTLGLTSPGRPVITIPLPLTTSRGVTFSLKEGSVYRLKFTFTVRHNIVSGLTYVHTVWKGGLQVDHTKIMLGTFSPHSEPYTQVMEEETTPSGLLARGAYTAKTKFIDDDDKCYLEINYSFDIRKEW